jgi:hypothetical protein
MASSTIIKAKTTFTFTGPDGTPVIVREGETFHKDASRLRGLSEEALANGFEAFRPDYGIEQATAAPGESRKRPKGKKDSEATAAPGESPQKPEPAESSPEKPEATEDSAPKASE